MRRPRLADLVTREPDFQTMALRAAILTPLHHRGLVHFGRRAHRAVVARIRGSLENSFRCRWSMRRPRQEMDFREVWSRECAGGFAMRVM